MECPRSTMLIVLVVLAVVNGMPANSTTARSPQFGDAIRRLSGQLMEVNSSSSDMVAFDVRTPPKIKQHAKKKDKAEISFENSHAGVAIPVDEDTLEETTKKLHYYKLDRPTTNSGLSTWILLSGQTVTTTVKPPTTTTPKLKESNVTLTMSENANRIGKPFFMKRVVGKPTTIKIKEKIKSTTQLPTSLHPKEPTKLFSVKTSTTTSATNKKNSTVISPIKKTISTSIKSTVTQTNLNPNNSTVPSLLKPVNSSLNSSKNSTVIRKTTSDKNATAFVPVATTVVSTSSNSKDLPIEGKDGEIDLANAKKKKTNAKRKKNKNRRKRPTSEETNKNSTKLAKTKPAFKEKPLGTQLYNYLSREMMPTLGVGLVGLMVTAGLASYFLYPFSPVRRSYEVDRRDKAGSYYYRDAYSGGIAEEEAIGKVIAGMPANSLHSNAYKTPTSRNTFSNVRHRHVDNTYYPKTNVQNSIVQGTVETVPLNSHKDSYMSQNAYQTELYQPVNYNAEVMERNEETEYAVNDKQFVVGNVPKLTVDDVITPAAVPEHGPRSIKFRRKREDNDIDNEIFNTLDGKFATPSYPDSTSGSSTIFNKLDGELTSSTTTSGERLDVSTPHVEHNINSMPANNTVEDNKFRTILRLVKDIIHLKLNLGLELVKNATRSISTFAEKVQRKLNDNYRNYHTF